MASAGSSSAAEGAGTSHTGNRAPRRPGLESSKRREVDLRLRMINIKNRHLVLPPFVQTNDVALYGRNYRKNILDRIHNISWLQIPAWVIVAPYGDDSRVLTTAVKHEVVKLLKVLTLCRATVAI